mmetsp:Transcript_88815/g.248588  ORF Transcript_88815/g.248588 Transcript_88815/m.248588 type:complete len:294 (-) Transcript_88815:1021-1902(-)
MIAGDLPGLELLDLGNSAGDLLLGGATALRLLDGVLELLRRRDGLHDDLQLPQGPRLVVLLLLGLLLDRHRVLLLVHGLHHARAAHDLLHRVALALPAGLLPRLRRLVALVLLVRLLLSARLAGRRGLLLAAGLLLRRGGGVRGNWRLGLVGLVDGLLLLLLRLRCGLLLHDLFLKNIVLFVVVLRGDGAGGDEHLHHGLVLEVLRVVQRHVAFEVLYVDVRLRRQQALRHRLVAVGDGEHQRRATIVVARLHVGAVLQQHGDDVGLHLVEGPLPPRAGPLGGVVQGRLLGVV